MTKLKIASFIALANFLLLGGVLTFFNKLPRTDAGNGAPSGNELFDVTPRIDDQNLKAEDNGAAAPAGSSNPQNNVPSAQAAPQNNASDSAPPPPDPAQNPPPVQPAANRCIITVQGRRYDVTDFRNIHTGGDIFQCGADMTNVFFSQHNQSVLDGPMTQYLVQ